MNASGQMRAARRLFVCTALAAAAILAIRIPGGVETDVTRMIDADGETVPSAVVTRFSSLGRAVAEASSPEDAVSAARELSSLMPSAAGEADSFRAFLDEIASHRSGLLPDGIRRRLAAGEFESVARERYAHLVSSPVPGIVPAKDDPFSLASAFLAAAAPDALEGWSWHDGFPVRRTEDGRFAALAEFDFSGLAGRESVAAARRISARAAEISARGGGCVAGVSGAPFHATASADAAAREINILSCVSVAAVFALGFAAFGTVRFAVPLLAALASGFLFASAALYAAFPRPHAVSFVFGTSLIGLSVDYCYHWLGALRSAGSARGAWQAAGRPLSASLATSLACFSPMLFSPLPVLRQMAVFSMAGLAAVFSATALFGGFAVRFAGRSRAVARAEEPPRAHCCGFARFALFAAFAALCAAGLGRVRVSADFRTLYSPSARLAADEALCAKALGSVGAGFAVVRAASVQEALEKEEDAGVRGLSSMIPSLRRQRENAALARRLAEEKGKWFESVTGIPAAAVAETPPLDPEKVRSGILRRMVDASVVRCGSGILLVSPAKPGMRAAGVDTVDVAEAMSAVWTRLTEGMLRTALFSALALALASLCLFGRRSPALAAPVLAAAAAALSVRGIAGMDVSVFDILAIFIVCGIGADYAIFANFGDGGRETRKIVGISFLSSLAGLGMLAFTSFPAVKSMGMTCALGLAFSYLFAGACGRRSEAAQAAPDCSAPWYAQREQSAGRFRLALVWAFYSTFGKSAMKAITPVILAFIYPFARPARRAVAEFYGVLSEKTGRRFAPTHRRIFRHLLDFAWSLSDMVDSLTLRRALPEVSIRGDASGRRFGELLEAGKGMFLVSSHLGSMEVFSAARGVRRPRVHAFRAMGQTPLFMRMVMRRYDSPSIEMHPVESVGVETAAMLHDALARGEIAIMAGDRSPGADARTAEAEFLGRRCRWPGGVFALARLAGAPVFFAVCVRTGREKYEVHLEEFFSPVRDRRGTERAMLEAFVSFLERETLAFPLQWHNFYGFFD